MSLLPRIMSEDEKRNLAAREEAAKTGADATHDEEPAVDPVQRRSSPWRRLSMITIILLLWLAWAVHKHNSRPKIIYADR